MPQGIDDFTIVLPELTDMGTCGLEMYDRLDRLRGRDLWVSTPRRNKGAISAARPQEDLPAWVTFANVKCSQLSPCFLCSRGVLHPSPNLPRRQRRKSSCSGLGLRCQIPTVRDLRLLSS